MENKIPIPTDNIFKFYALFGLLIFIFSASSVIYVTRSTNELVFQTVIELETMKEIPNPTVLDTTKIQILEKRLAIAASDKNLFLVASGAIAGIAILLMF